MAVPTISTITPSVGPGGGGNVIKVTGTNFRQYTPPAYGPSDGVAHCYVRVTVGGEVAVVHTYSATELGVVVPPYGGDIDVEIFPPVDLVLANLDDDGDPISGETATALEAYTYQREPLRQPTMVIEPAFTRLARGLLKMIKRDLLLQSAISTAIEYSEDGLVTATAGVPSIALTGPGVAPDAYGWESEAIEVTQEDGSVLTYATPVMHTLEFGLLGFSDSKQEQLTLMTGLRKVFWRHPYLVLSGDLPSNSLVKMPLVVTDEPRPGLQVADANLRGFVGAIEVRRVPVLYLPAFQRTWPVSTISLQAQKVNGTLVETRAL